MEAEKTEEVKVMEMEKDTLAKEKDQALDH